MRTLTSRAAVIDLHSHLLPGIDDGAADMDASLAMARAAVAGGVEAIVATPHVSSTYRNDPASFRERVAEVQAAVDGAGIPLRVHKGAELSIAGFHDLPEGALEHCVLGDGNYILLEPPLSGAAPFVERLAADIAGAGFRIVLAHPERIAAFHRDVSLLERLVEQGAITSVTAASLNGQFGGQVKRFTEDLFARGLVHNLASDAHDADRRSPRLRQQLERALAEMPELEGWLEWLTVDVPGAVVGGAAVTGDPPVIERKRGLLGRLRRR
jgi:protein-tyrosine phosphatase